jgi:hypothetical protein
VAFRSANASPQYHRLSQLFPLLEGGEFDGLLPGSEQRSIAEAAKDPKHREFLVPRSSAGAAGLRIDAGFSHNQAGLERRDTT